MLDAIIVEADQPAGYYGNREDLQSVIADALKVLRTARYVRSVEQLCDLSNKL
jgi:hypothetical protein